MSYITNLYPYQKHDPYSKRSNICPGSGLCFIRRKKDWFYTLDDIECKHNCEEVQCKTCKRKYPQWFFDYLRCYCILSVSSVETGKCYYCIEDDEKGSDYEEDDLASDCSFDYPRLYTPSVSDDDEEEEEEEEKKRDEPCKIWDNNNETDEPDGKIWRVSSYNEDSPNN